MKDFSYDVGHVPFIEFVHVISTSLFFFQAYLQCQTPKGLKELREKELMELRGDGHRLRAPSDRLHD